MRDYGHSDQLGLESTPEEYLKNMLNVFDLVKPKLKDVGNCFVNLGDTYAGSGGAGGDYNVGGLREGQPKFKQGAFKQTIFEIRDDLTKEELYYVLSELSKTYIFHESV